MVSEIKRSDLRIVRELARGANNPGASFDQDCGTIGYGKGRLDVLLNQHDCDTGSANLDELFEDDADELWRKAGRGLIQHQDLRLPDQRSSNSEHLALAA
jgi:hypothetical protein